MRRYLLIAIAALTAVTGARAADDPEQEPTEEQIKAAVAALEGVVLPRSAGGWVQVTMQDNRLVLRFYNEKAKPVKPDVDRAVIRVNASARSPERVVLVPMGDGMSLRHGHPLRGPFAYKLFIDFFRGESQESVESFQTNYP
jgi:hypothetical protein